MATSEKEVHVIREFLCVLNWRNPHSAYYDIVFPVCNAQRVDSIDTLELVCGAISPCSSSSLLGHGRFGISFGRFFQIQPT